MLQRNKPKMYREQKESENVDILDYKFGYRYIFFNFILVLKIIFSKRLDNKCQKTGAREIFYSKNGDTFNLFWFTILQLNKFIEPLQDPINDTSNGRVH